jgi:hypothetical protein
MAAKGSEGTRKIEPGPDLPLMCFLSLLWPIRVFAAQVYFVVLSDLSVTYRITLAVRPIL